MTDANPEQQAQNVEATTIKIDDSKAGPPMLVNAVLPGVAGNYVQLDFAYISTQLSEEITSGEHAGTTVYIPPLARVILPFAVVDGMIAAIAGVRDKHEKKMAALTPVQEEPHE